MSGADQAFAGFQSNNHIEPVMGVPHIGELGHDRLVGAPNPMIASRPSAPGASVPGFAVQPPPPFAVASPVNPAAATHQAVAARDWVNQFSTMQLGNANTQTSAPTMVSPQHRAPAFSSPQFGGAGAFAPMYLPFQHGPSQLMTPGAMYGNQATAMQHTESNLDIEAFNKAFGDYDEAEFKDELANWAKDKEEVEEEQTAQQGLQQDAPHAAEEVAEAPQERENTRRIRDDEELAQAALSILNSVSGNDSEKFKNSNFLELMRRIGNREVVVDGSNLVNAETGEALVNKDMESPPDMLKAPETRPAA